MGTVLHVVGTAGNTPVGEAPAVADDPSVGIVLRILDAGIGADKTGRAGGGIELEVGGDGIIGIQDGNDVLDRTGIGSAHFLHEGVLDYDVSLHGVRIEIQVAAPGKGVGVAVIQEEDGGDVIVVLDLVNGGMCNHNLAGTDTGSVDRGLAQDEVALAGRRLLRLDVRVGGQVVLLAGQGQVDGIAAFLEIQGEQMVGIQFFRRGGHLGGVHPGGGGEFSLQRIQNRLIAGSQTQDHASDQYNALFHKAHVLDD